MDSDPDVTVDITIRRELNCERASDDFGGPLFLSIAGLGREVFGALAVVDTGLGLEAGPSIVFLAIVLDRLTQAWSRKQQEALGL